MGINHCPRLTIVVIFCALNLDITRSDGNQLVHIQSKGSGAESISGKRLNGTIPKNHLKFLPKNWMPRQNIKYQKKKSGRNSINTTQNDYANLHNQDGSAPRQPSISLRKTVIYDPHHAHFHIKSPDSLHIKVSPVREKGSPWPMPKLYKVNRSKYHYIDTSSFGVYVKQHYNDVIDFNLKRFWAHVFQMNYQEAHHLNRSSYRQLLEKPTSAKNGLTALEINIEVTSRYYPTASMNESYSFTIRRDDGVIQLDCHEVWGAIRGLETISQLIQEDKNGLFLPEVMVHDSPRFPHRGLMIDTARHFIQKRFLLENLEAMVQNKLNVFHWHMTDDQSFPFESLVFPNLTKYGAYNPETHVYKQSDIAEVIEEARVRGIRVIPEFDSPGHTFSWGYGQPDILTPCYNSQGKVHFFGPLHPLHEETYEVLARLYEEILAVFPDNLVHIGGDEVYKSCWQSNPEIQSYMKANHTGVNNILATFSTRLQKIVQKMADKRNQTRDTEKYGGEPFQMLAWQEAFDEDRKLSSNTIVQVWKNDERYVRGIIEKGYKVIFSSCWYLDMAKFGMDWDRFYNCFTAKSDPTDYNGNLLGGEICLWTEFVDDQSLMPKLWPRASAPAERLWSPASVSNFEEAGRRIEEQNCRMKGRGINSGVLSGPSFCDLRKSRPGLIRSVTESDSGHTKKEDTEEFDGQLGKVISMRQIQERPLNILEIGTLVIICMAAILHMCRTQALTSQRIPRLKKRQMLIVVVTLVVLMLIANIMRLHM